MSSVIETFRKGGEKLHRNLARAALTGAGEVVEGAIVDSGGVDFYEYKFAGKFPKPVYLESVRRGRTKGLSALFPGTTNRV